MLQLTLQPVPSQQLKVVLGGQNCLIAVNTKTTGIYVDVSVNGASISAGVVARNGVSLVPTSYLGFIGYLLFIDTQGTSDPTYDGLGSRYQLLYLTAADLATLGIA